ncbi:hypothetical protein [Rubritalea sp.]|uniref:hypothetical protein n=1 Tax=Rubritalea sp. TaxID=2109375 RepID=UPI003EF672A6
MKTYFKTCLALCAWAVPTFVQAQDLSNDILFVSVGESSDNYSDAANHLESLLAGTVAYSDVQVDTVQNSTIETLADGYYDQNSADVALRAKVVEGYRHVILTPTIHTVPTGTVEYSEYNGGPTNIYDDAPYDNGYFAPEVFYEGCTQFSSLILNSGTTIPMIFLPNNADQDFSEIGEVMYRVANGVDMELIPGSYAVESDGATTAAEEQYLYACTMFSKITGLNAGTSSYSPSGITTARAVSLAETAAATVNLHASTVHYDTSYENDGAVVYRSLDVTEEPFNDVVRYMYKGSSTHDWTSDALDLIINSNVDTTAASRKLGTRNGVYSTGVRYWHPDDLDPDNAGYQGFKFALEPDEAAFMYVSGSWSGADAQDVIDLTQSNMIPMAFDWIKSFAIGGESGTAATLDALDYHSCSELYFNYAERGWKLIPLTIGMGRLNEATEDFSASEDALHCSDLLVYMNAYMMLSSSLGTQFPLPAEITADDIHRGSHTTEAIHEACLIGHDVIKELAFLSETGAHVPESDLEVETSALPEVPLDSFFSYQLSASGGDGNYSWEWIADTDLPEGLTLSSDGVLSGTVTTDEVSRNAVFRVTDGVGAMKKISSRLAIELPQGDISQNTAITPAANTDYGTDTVATMYTATLTAPDGLATFRLAVDLVPMAGASIVSDSSSHWGIKSGTAAAAWDNTFDGSLGESVDSVSNIRVVDFSANGSELTSTDFTGFSFKALEVLSGNHSKDRVKVTIDALSNVSQMSASPESVDLQALASTSSVTNFKVETGNANSSNRWALGDIEVDYTIQMPYADYDEWVAKYGLSGDSALATADVENGSTGDGYSNLLEFALGMNPTQSDAGTREAKYTELDGENSYFVYEYERRTDYLEKGLSYSLIVTEDLATPSVEVPFDVEVDAAVDGFETIRSRFPIDVEAKFIQLKVQRDE